MSNKPPNDEIAAYAQEYVTCRSCGAQPGLGCIEQADRWRTVCVDRFADAAAIYAPIWKDAHGRRSQLADPDHECFFTDRGRPCARGCGRVPLCPLCEQLHIGPQFRSQPRPHFGCQLAARAVS